MRISTLDAHVAGAAVRLVTSGLASSGSGSLGERSAAQRSSCGEILSSLASEPRGHDGTVVVAFAEPDHTDADAGVLVHGAHGPIALCGHGVIGATVLGLSRGLLVPRRPGMVLLDTLAGRVTVRADGSEPLRASYLGPAARIVAANRAVTIGRRSLYADLVTTGGETLAIVDAEAAGVPLVASRLLELQRGSLELMRALESQSVGGVVFLGAAPEHGVDVRSATVYEDGVVERSPGGGSTVALAVVLTAMGALTMGQRLVHQGVFGSLMEATVNAASSVDGVHVFEVEVASEVWPTGDHEFVFLEGDPSWGAADRV
jgi:proline racemase